jgi:hypothetical protein
MSSGTVTPPVLTVVARVTTRTETPKDTQAAGALETLDNGPHRPGAV